MKECLIFGFDLETFSFVSRNHPEIDIVGWFGVPDFEPNKDGVITFEDSELLARTQHTDKPQAVRFFRRILPSMVPDTMPIPVLNSFCKSNFHNYSELEQILERVYVLEALLDRSVIKGINVLAEPGVLVDAHTTLSHGVSLKSHVRVGKNCVIGSLTSIGDRSYIEDGCIIGSNVTIGEGVFVEKGSFIPDDSQIEPGARIKRNDF
jgi:NDP-sugar pyrophosphorylase family protein